MTKIVKLVVGKGRTTKPSEQEEWLKQYYELEIMVDDPGEVELARSNALGLLDGWLSQIPRAPPEAKAKSEIPNVDLHELEHDPAWRSWKKDESGQCIFSVEEGRAGWIRIKNAGNTVLALVKAMKRENLEKVSLGLFEYRLSGEDFLQRRPLKKPDENSPHAKMEKNIQNGKQAGEKLTQGAQR